MTRVDLLLMHIDRVLAECDASRMPPLTSEPAAAVLDLAEQAGLKVDPWQASVVRAMYAEPAPRLLWPPRPDPTLWPESIMVEPRPEQARGWLARWIGRVCR